MSKRRSGRMRASAATAFLLALGQLALAPPSLAQGSPATQERRSYQIPTGPLADALNRFASEAGVALVFEPQEVASRQAPAVEGIYTVQEGFAQLLGGSGLRAVTQPDGSWTLVKIPEGAAVLPAVKVESTAVSSVTEGSGSYATRAVGVAGKTARNPREIQQSVTVVTAQRIKDQVLTTAEEALGQATGVTMTQGTGYTSNASFSSRGFAMGVQVDGGAVGVNNLWYHTGLPDIAILDHVEVLRGSDALFAGSGSPGGTVNLVRKQPLREKQVTFDALAASWDRYRTQIDATAPLGFDGRLRGRFATAQEKRHYFYDGVSSEKSVLYGVVNADLTDSTLLVLGSSYEKMDRHGLFFGLPRYSTGADLKLPRETCLCADWSGRNDESRELFARVEQGLGEGWNLKLNVGQQWLDYQYKQGNVDGAVSPATGVGPRMAASRTDVSNTVQLADFTLDGAFEVLGHRQELVLGWNWQDMYSDGSGVSLYTTRPPADVFDFEDADFPEPGTPASYVPRKPFGGQRQSGAYVTLRSEWIKGLHSVIGLRNSNFKNRYTAGNLNTEERNVRTPYAGLSYDVAQAATMYFSYAQIYAPQSYSLGLDGKTIDPIEGDTFELGAKASWLAGALNASAAFYFVERSNMAVQVGTSPTVPNCCYEAQAEVQSRGFDAELVGELLPGWQMQLGYTFNLNEYKSGFGTNTGTRLSPRTPKHLVKLWTMTKLRGDWSALRVGGGVNWQSDNYVQGTAATYNPQSNEYDGPTVPFRYVQKAYAIANLRGEYQLNPQWSVAVNVNNLLDETYYQTVSSSTSGNFYGEPRNWVLSVSGRW